MKAKDVMTAPVITAHVDAPRTEVADLLAKNKVSAVPIVDDDGAVVGLVSEYDLLAKPDTAARGLMTPSVITVSEDTDLDDVRVLLVDRRIRRVPVLAGQQLVGIVSRSDLVALIPMEWVCEACGEPVRGESPPSTCPRCGSPRDRFVQQQQPPAD